MQRRLLKLIILSLLCFTKLSTAQSPISDLEDESNLISSLSGLLRQSIFHVYSPGVYEDSMRQSLTLDWHKMEIVYRRTPHKPYNYNKPVDKISWQVQFHIPFLEIDSVYDNYQKQTMTFKMKGDSNSILGEYLIPGMTYAPASQDNSLTIYSGQIMKIRNLTERIRDHIKWLQEYHYKKQQLVTTLNQYLQQEITYQEKEPDNYPADRKFTIVQPFRLDSMNKLSIIVKRDSIIEEQGVYLEDVVEIAKDINVLLRTAGNKVENKQTFPNGKTFTNSNNLFFLQLCYKKNNEALGDQLQHLFKTIGSKATKKFWAD